MIEPSKIRVLIVEDHSVVRKGLCELLEKAPDIEVIGDTEYGEEGLALVQEHAPDVLLLDLVLDTSQVTGHDVLKQVVLSSPMTRVVVLSAYSDEQIAFPALYAGAMGYMLKSAYPNEVIEAVRDAAAGRYHVAPLITKKIVDHLLATRSPVEEASDTPELTPREKEILPLISRGLSNLEIADYLTIAPTTAKTHVSNILHKLGLKDRTKVALWMTQHPL